MVEKRKDERKALRVPVQVTLANGQVMRTRTVDISLGGLCIASPQSLPPGLACQLLLVLPLKQGQHHRLNVAATVVYSVVARAEGVKVGLQLRGLDDAGRAAIAQCIQA